MSEWISVKEKFPTGYKEVIIYAIPDKKFKKGFSPKIFIAKYCYCSGWTEIVSNHILSRFVRDGKDGLYYDHLHIHEITHWMPLPEIPNDT